MRASYPLPGTAAFGFAFAVVFACVFAFWAEPLGKYYEYAAGPIKSNTYETAFFVVDRLAISG